MAQSVPPGDIGTQPGTKIVFNAPYDDKHTYHIKITNAGGRRIGWAIKTTNMKRLGVDPPCGVLDPKENVLMAVSCDAFKFVLSLATNDFPDGETGLPSSFSFETVSDRRLRPSRWMPFV
uniref:MSP domain-containing protein n=1 Tax=Panagrellus redivivus TaxID=6233 RepID=A0A7E4W924_PANRE